MTGLWITPGKCQARPVNVRVRPAFVRIAPRKPLLDKALRLLKTFKNVLKTARTREDARHFQSAPQLRKEADDALTGSASR
jgi:hypothetical protein